LIILADMAEDRNLPKFFIDDLRRIENGLKLIDG